MARLQGEVSQLEARSQAEGETWAQRCEGLRQALAAQEGRSAALEAQLASRPTAQQVTHSPRHDAEPKATLLDCAYIKISWGLPMSASDSSDICNVWPRQIASLRCLCPLQPWCNHKEAHVL